MPSFHHAPTPPPVAGWLRRAFAFVGPLSDRRPTARGDPPQQAEQPDVGEPVLKLCAEARLEIGQQVELAAVVAAQRAWHEVGRVHRPLATYQANKAGDLVPLRLRRDAERTRRSALRSGLLRRSRALRRTSGSCELDQGARAVRAHRSRLAQVVNRRDPLDAPVADPRAGS
jgi:hypothetical protein